MQVGLSFFSEAINIDFRASLVRKVIFNHFVLASGSNSNVSKDQAFPGKPSVQLKCEPCLLITVTT
jgi:hypothetical protein